MLLEVGFISPSKHLDSIFFYFIFDLFFISYLTDCILAEYVGIKQV